MAQSETDVQDRAQSERIIALESTYAHVATKADIGSLRSDLKNMRWMIGAIIAGAPVLVAGAKLLVTLALRT